MTASLVSMTVNSPSAASLSMPITVPSNIASGDLAFLLIHTNSNSGTLTPPAGWTLVAQRGPLTGANCESWLMSKTLSASDASTTLTATWSGTAPRFSMLLAVVRDAVLDQTPIGYDDDTTDTTITLGSFAPVADNCLALILSGVTTTGNQGAYTVTPPTGWTKDADANGAYASASNVGVWGAHLQLSGGAGVAQAIANAVATKTVRANSFAIPLTDAPPPGTGWRLVTASGAIPMTLKIAS